MHKNIFRNIFVSLILVLALSCGSESDTDKPVADAENIQSIKSVSAETPDGSKSSISTVPIKNLADGLVAYYPFNGNAHDESGNLHHGEIEDASLTEDRFGNSIRAYSFDGKNDFIYFGKVLPDMATMSISIWVYSENGNTIICDGDWETGNDITLKINDNSTIGVRADKNNYELLDDIEVKKDMYNNWRHIVWIMTNKESKLYVDGSYIGSLDKGGSNVGYHNFMLGTEEFPKGSYGWGGFWKGKLSDIRIYNRALSEPEIEDLYKEENRYTSL